MNQGLGKQGCRPLPKARRRRVWRWAVPLGIGLGAAALTSLHAETTLERFPILSFAFQVQVDEEQNELFREFWQAGKPVTRYPSESLVEGEVLVPPDIAEVLQLGDAKSVDNRLVTLTVVIRGSNPHKVGHCGWVGEDWECRTQ